MKNTSPVQSKNNILGPILRYFPSNAFKVKDNVQIWLFASLELNEDRGAYIQNYSFPVVMATH